MISVSDLLEVFESQGGAAYLGEPVTMAEHMLQAAHLAERDGRPEAVIAAALLHDIGHFTSAISVPLPWTIPRTGATRPPARETLTALFPPLVIDCVREHVAAKRYLCAVDPAYHDELSAASRHSLRLQGGPMSAAEAEAFARHPHLEAILAVRTYDDLAKVAGRQVPGLDHYVPLLRRVSKDRPTG